MSVGCGECRRVPAGLEAGFQVGLLSSALRLKFESKGAQLPQWSRFLEKVHPVLLRMSKENLS